jgi:hypothetical protein
MLRNYRNGLAPSIVAFLLPFLRADHGCASGPGGTCPACNSGPVLIFAESSSEGRTKRAAPALVTARAFVADRSRLSKVAHGLAKDAAGIGLVTASKALAGLVEPLATASDRKALGSLTARMERNRSEIEKATEGRARRAAKATAKAAKRHAKRIAAQASLIALRVSQDATYRVWIRFARGAHAILIATEAPKGFREARASVKVRGDSPGLRYGAAERIRDGISRKMAAPRRHA